MKRLLATALTGVCVVGLVGCKTLQKIPAFQPAPELKYEAPGSVRMPLTPPDQQIAPAPALKGVGFALPQPSVVTDWPLPGGTPEQSIEHVQAAPALEIAWKRKIGSGSSKTQFITAPPIVVGGRIFTMDAGSRIQATNALTGQGIWIDDFSPEGGYKERIPTLRFPFLKTGEFVDYRAFGGGLAYDAGKLFVTSGYRFVAALDPTNGNQLWRTPVTIPIHGAPTAGGGRVFAVNTSNELETFDAATGRPGWEFHALVEPARILQASSPALSGDSVVATFSSGEVSVLQANNGNELWTGNLIHASRTTALSEIRDIPGRPVVYKGDVYAGGHSGAFAAVELRTGAQRWQLPIVTTATPWVAGDVVYVVSKAGEVMCISRANGQIYWITSLNANLTENEKRSGFLGLGNDVNTRVYWTGVILASNRLITVSSSGLATALDAKTGAVQKTIKLGAPALIAPIAAGNMLYVLLDNGDLVALR